MKKDAQSFGLDQFKNKSLKNLNLIFGGTTNSDDDDNDTEKKRLKTPTNSAEEGDGN